MRFADNYESIERSIRQDKARFITRKILRSNTRDYKLSIVKGIIHLL